jgi:hypothetical protein
MLSYPRSSGRSIAARCCGGSPLRTTGEVEVSATYEALGSQQCQIVEWVIAAGQIKSRYRGLVNLIVGMLLAGAFSGLAAWQAGDWAILSGRLLAGMLASVEAARVHDGQEKGASERV